jgi:hypothetical protein
VTYWPFSSLWTSEILHRLNITMLYVSEMSELIAHHSWQSYAFPAFLSFMTVDRIHKFSAGA